MKPSSDESGRELDSCDNRSIKDENRRVGVHIPQALNCRSKYFGGCSTLWLYRFIEEKTNLCCIAPALLGEKGLADFVLPSRQMSHGHIEGRGRVVEGVLICLPRMMMELRF